MSHHPKKSTVTEPHRTEVFAGITLGVDGRVMSWSAEAQQLTGYAASEVLGKPFEIFHSVENLRRGKAAEVLKLANETGRVSYLDWHVRKDSSHFWADFRVTSVSLQSAGLSGYHVEMRLASPTNQVAEKFSARNIELEKQLGERTVQLGNQTSKLDERTSQLTAKTIQFDSAEALNVELEEELDVRTTQLGMQTTQLSAKTKEFNTVEALNLELEAFTYAASHDLRAPLRSIDGFSQVLLEDYNDKLDAMGQDHLRRIRAAAQRMGRLIDDLIGLSSVTRGALKLVPCDIAYEAEKIATELKRMAPERQVEFEFEKTLPANCDLALIRIVLENLLGNAFKYTSKRQRAEIKLGSKTSDGESVYFIRDNGAGFDMKYVHKLFGPFQRLHGISEFEGNGIGLATVKRIINRHGGEVWAESQVDIGTTIFFTV